MMYLLLKTIHVTAVLTFFAGLLNLALALSGWARIKGVALPHETSIGRGMLRWDERVTLPAMFASWGLGLALVATGAAAGQAWVIAKIVLVMLLSALHGVLRSALNKRVNGGQPARLRWYAASPFLVFAITGMIVFLVIFKPFAA